MHFIVKLFVINCFLYLLAKTYWKQLLEKKVTKKTTIIALLYIIIMMIQIDGKGEEFLIERYICACA